MKKYIFLLFMFIGTISFAQNSRLDSLLNAQQQNKLNDTNKVKTYNLISWEYFITSNLDESQKYAEKSIALATSLNFLKGKAEAINYTGNIHAQKAEYPAALNCYKKSIEIKKQINDQKGIAAGYNNIGNVLWSQGNIPEALKYQLEALKIRELIANIKGISQSFINLSNIYLSQKNYDEALKYTFKALALQKTMDDPFLLGTTYNNLGNIYSQKFDYANSTKYHLLSKECKEKVGDKYGLALTYYNIGFNQLKTVDFKNAEDNLLISLKLSTETENTENVARIYAVLSEIEIVKKNYPKAQMYSKQALSIALTSDSKELKQNAYFVQVKNDSITQNWKGAYANLYKWMQYKDSLMNDENSKAILQQQMQYDFDKKEAETKAAQDKKDFIATKEAQNQKNILYAVSLGLLLVLILAGIIFKSLQTNKQKNKIISHQKNLVEEKQKEILASIHYAKRIQRSLLPTEKYIDKSLKRLKK
jgi:Tetratricopeptide repeat